MRPGRGLPVHDALIAGTVLAHGLTLVTRNVAEFGWVDGLTVLDPFAGPS